MTNIESEQKTGDSNEVKLGNKLRLLRESRGYSVKDISEQLYLDVSLIQALEAGDYSKFTSTVYVRGYIRNFIKLFDAMSEFKSFNLYESENNPQNIIPDSITYNKRYKNNHIYRFKVVYLLLTFSLLLAVYFNDIKFGVINFEVEKVMTAVRDLDTKLVEESNSVKTTEKIELISSNVETGRPEKIKLVINKPDSITMHFKSSSWTQIKDATGNKLVSRFVKSGKTLNFSGKLPFTVTLGNSHAVKISVNGNEFNQSNYNEKEITHFVIDNNNLN